MLPSSMPLVIRDVIHPAFANRTVSAMRVHTDASRWSSHVRGNDGAASNTPWISAARE